MNFSLLSPREVHFFASQSYESDLAYRQATMKPSREPAVAKSIANRRMIRILNKNGGTIQADGNQFLLGRSGLFNFDLLSGFGFIARGAAGRNNELILVTRGTNFEHNKYDLGTDLNIGLGLGPKGHPVHLGFLKTFRSYQQQLAQFVCRQGAKRPSVIHCIGHSLGGALANLNALALNDLGFNVNLYTVGAPRVGLLDFVMDLTRNIPSERICRVVNPCDPVPMVPLFPFMHASKGGSEYLITTTDKVAVQQHFMGSGYAQMARHTAWSALDQPTVRIGQKLENLDAELGKVGGGMMFSQTVLSLIGRAIVSLMKALGMVTLICLQNGLSGLFTAADLLAEILTKAYHAGKLFLEHAKKTMNLMLWFLGRLSMQTVNLEINTIRWVVNQFSCQMAGLAHRALQRNNNEHP